VTGDRERSPHEKKRGTPVVEEGRSKKIQEKGRFLGGVMSWRH